MEILLILLYTVPGCISISGFAFLVDIPIGVSSSAVGLKICAIAPRIKKNKSIIRKKRKKHNEIVLLANTKLYNTESLIAKVSIDLYINHKKMALVNNMLQEYDGLKEVIKNTRITNSDNL